MSPNIKKDICKMYIDLWMHQNALMFSRLHTLWFVQIGFLGLAGYISIPHTPIPNGASVMPSDLEPLAKFVALLCAITTFGLWVMIRTDRVIRNIYRRKIEELNLGFFPASLGQKPYEEDEGITLVEPIFYYVVFFVFVSIDLYAADFFGIRKDVLCLFIGVFLVISLALPTVEYMLARKDS